MKVLKGNEEIWKAIDLIGPRHYSSFRPRIRCSDNNPFNSGNFGCKRCDLILDIERRKKIVLVK
ncbi:hypothetical protein GOV14_00740 [Candidatus Pacearchaeota archaeon]|nr:hypothetical protein [Candidatus Pacearchaeota archaeon]